jgi:hypothetical protein
MQRPKAGARWRKSLGSCARTCRSWADSSSARCADGSRLTARRRAEQGVFHLRSTPASIRGPDVLRRQASSPTPPSAGRVGPPAPTLGTVSPIGSASPTMIAPRTRCSAESWDCSKVATSVVVASAPRSTGRVETRVPRRARAPRRRRLSGTSHARPCARSVDRREAPACGSSLDIALAMTIAAGSRLS